VVKKVNAEKYKFSSDEIERIKRYRDKQKNGQLKIRFIALLMLADDCPLPKVASLLGCGVTTVIRWFKIYLLTGIESLNHFNYQPKQTYLTYSQITELAAWVRENNPGSIKEILEYIIKNFGVVYTHDAVLKLLKKRGLKFMKPELFPGKPPTVEEQKQFIKEYNELRKDSEKTGTVIIFCDAMHLVHQTVPSYCWGDPKHPPAFKTSSGRQRLNIIGGYDPVRHRFIHNTGEANCDAGQAIIFFDKLLKAYPQADRIEVILDNASYFHANETTDWLKEHPEICCRFLPAYSPNLNLIERFWRFVKNKLVKNRYFEKYKTFRCNVFRLLNHISDYKDELKSLMTEKFQIIDYAHLAI
jgi:transposase